MGGAPLRTHARELPSDVTYLDNMASLCCRFAVRRSRALWRKRFPPPAVLGSRGNYLVQFTYCNSDIPCKGMVSFIWS